MTPHDLIEKEVRTASTIEDCAGSLAKLLSGGFSVWEDGSLYSIKQLVARVHGSKIEVFAREHPPPHFHISGGGISATFSHIDCTHLTGHIGVREAALVKWWYDPSRPALVIAWNTSRPSNCPVGPMHE
jgi:hypothetical protein